MITSSEVAELLTMAQSLMRFRPGTDRSPITETDVAVWGALFADANCNHPAIMRRAIVRFMGSPEAAYGIQPDGLIKAYKSTALDIAARTPGWDQLDYSQRQAVLADPPPQRPAIAAAQEPDADVVAEVARRAGIDADDLGKAGWVFEVRARKTGWQAKRDDDRAAAARAELEAIRNQGETE